MPEPTRSRDAARCQQCGSSIDSFGFCRCEAGPTFTEAEADAKLVGHYGNVEGAIADRYVMATIGRGVALLQERGWAVADIETAIEQHLSAAYDREESK